jgi:hypothetical protein
VAGWYDSSQALSGAGTRLLQLGTNKPAATTPAVNLANSNCASAAG